MLTQNHVSILPLKVNRIDMKISSYHKSCAKDMDTRPMRNSDILLLASIIALLVYFSMSLLVPGFMSPIAVVYNWLLDISLLFGYFGDFLISFLGNATVLIPFPYMGVSFILGGLSDGISGEFLFDPWLVGLVAGLGAVIGEMTGYLIGYTGGHFIDKNQRNAFRNYVNEHPNATPFILWFLAATPLPDDVLILPLGAAKYPWWKVMIPQFIGKTMFMTVVAWSGRIGLGIVGNLIGNTAPSSIVSRSVEIASLFLIVLAIYALVRINWTKLMFRSEKLESADQ
jgi:membrane protein YqaA with SNARE-associated domain